VVGGRQRVDKGIPYHKEYKQTIGSEEANNDMIPAAGHPFSSSAESTKSKIVKAHLLWYYGIEEILTINRGTLALLYGKTYCRMNGSE
jgi:hypothetical protein